MKTKKLVIAIAFAVAATLALAWYGGGNNENADNRQGVLVENQEETDDIHVLLSVKRGQPCNRM